MKAVHSQKEFWLLSQFAGKFAQTMQRSDIAGTSRLAVMSRRMMIECFERSVVDVFHKHPGYLQCGAFLKR